MTLLGLKSLCLGCLVLAQAAPAAEPTREEVLAAMRPYAGPATSGVDRTTKDGHLVLMHDANLDHTTNGQGPVNSLTLAEVRQLDAGSRFGPQFRGERVATLEEVLPECKGKIDVLLDLKESGDAYHQNVIGMIRQLGEPGRTIFGVRSIQQAKEFRKLLPEARQLGLLARSDEIEAYAQAGVEMIRLWPRWLTDRTLVDRVRRAGCKLHLNGETGTRDETAVLLQHSPDSLSSNHPHRLVATLAEFLGDAK